MHFALACTCEREAEGRGRRRSSDLILRDRVETSSHRTTKYERVERENRQRAEPSFHRRRVGRLPRKCDPALGVVSGSPGATRRVTFPNAGPPHLSRPPTGKRRRRCLPESPSSCRGCPGLGMGAGRGEEAPSREVDARQASSARRQSLPLAEREPRCQSLPFRPATRTLAQRVALFV
jgi:hypothetical protein